MKYIIDPLPNSLNSWAKRYTNWAHIFYQRCHPWHITFMLIYPPWSKGILEKFNLHFWCTSISRTDAPTTAYYRVRLKGFKLVTIEGRLRHDSHASSSTRVREKGNPPMLRYMCHHEDFLIIKWQLVGHNKRLHFSRYKKEYRTQACSPKLSSLSEHEFLQCVSFLHDTIVILPNPLSPPTSLCFSFIIRCLTIPCGWHPLTDNLTKTNSFLLLPVYYIINVFNSISSDWSILQEI